MRILWTLFKVILGLAIAIPVGFFLFAIAAGVLGTVLGLAIGLLRLAIFGAIGYGLFRLGKAVFGSKPAPQRMRDLPAADPYYDAAVRELDTHLGNR